MSGKPEFRWQAVGRRKTSVARVYLVPGTGKWSVNGRTIGAYFPRSSLVQHIQQPLNVGKMQSGCRLIEDIDRIPRRQPA